MKSGAAKVFQHPLAKDAIGASLIALARFLQPGDYIRIEPHGNGTFDWTIETTTNSVFPGSQRQFGNVRGIDDVVR